MRFPTPFVSAVLSCALGAAAVLACSNASPDLGEESGTEQLSSSDKNDIFSKPEAFEVKISAPLSTLFARYKAGQADPPEADASKPGEQEFSEPAKMEFTHDGEKKILDLRVYVRGESSKNDCPFTKLKLDFADKEQLKKTPFKGHGKMRLNTHCGPGDASARSGMGRVFNGVGPVREELTYRLIRAAGIPTYRTRVIAVHYDDTADKSQLDTFGMLVESGDDAVQRFLKMEPPLVPEKTEYLDPNAAWSVTITPENTAQIAIAEAFSGNKDWGGTHNIDTFAVPAATTGLQIAQDFDLGAITLGDIAHYWKGNAPVADAKTALGNATVAAAIRPTKNAMEAAYKEQEKAMIAAKAIASDDGVTTTDPGFLEAKKRIAELFDLPELQAAAAVDGGADATATTDAAPAPPADAGKVPTVDAGADAKK
ncbi:MAG: hypothetical protein JWM74_3251 [Myxococcaceae bacterium]|nr:hypothetical protein [Myxococcaceae bacterium]